MTSFVTVNKKHTCNITCINVISKVITSIVVVSFAYILLLVPGACSPVLQNLIKQHQIWCFDQLEC